MTNAHSRTGTWRDLTGMYKVGYWILRPIVRGMSKIRWQGMDNLPDTGPFILAPNHISSFDPVSMGFALGSNGYEVRFLAKESVFKAPVVGPFMRWWGMIPVVRGSSDSSDVLIHAREALEAGDVVGIYFEGTLTRDPAFWPMKGKTGLARLALDVRVPIIPVVQWGAQDVLDRYARLHLFQKRPKLYIRALPALEYGDIPGDSSNHDGVRELTRRLQDALALGSADLRQELAPEVPWQSSAHDGPSKKVLTRFAKWRRQLRKAAGRQDILPATPK